MRLSLQTRSVDFLHVELHRICQEEISQSMWSFIRLLLPLRLSGLGLLSPSLQSERAASAECKQSCGGSRLEEEPIKKTCTGGDEGFWSSHLCLGHTESPGKCLKVTDKMSSPHNAPHCPLAGSQLKQWDNSHLQYHAYRLILHGSSAGYICIL